MRRERDGGNKGLSAKSGALLACSFSTQWRPPCCSYVLLSLATILRKWTITVQKAVPCLPSGHWGTRDASCVTLVLDHSVQRQLQIRIQTLSQRKISPQCKKNVSLLPLWLVATGGASTPLVQRPLCFSYVIVVYRGSFKVSFHVLFFSACPLSDSWPLGKHTTSCLLFMCYFGTWPLSTTLGTLFFSTWYLTSDSHICMLLCGGLAATHGRHTSCSVVPFEGDGQQ